MCPGRLRRRTTPLLHWVAFSSFLHPYCCSSSAVISRPDKAALHQLPNRCINMTAHPRRLLILYGSQTGNAQDVAERVAREAQLLLYSPAVMPLDSYPIQQLPEERFVVFITATTGQGDPPDNMRRFWKLLLRKNLPPTILAGTNYAVFGLGDSGYVKYNVAAKKLDRRLAALGAVQLLDRGLGDDQHPSGYEASLDPWLQQLWAVLRTHNPLPPGVSEPVLDTTTLLQLTPPKYKVSLLPAPPTDQHQAPPTPQQREQLLIEQAVAAAAAFRAVAAEASGSSIHDTAAAPDSSSTVNSQQYGPWRPFMAPVLVNQRVTSVDHFQETRYLEFDLAGSGLQYQPGDLLAIFPRTPAADVEAALARLGLDGDSWVRIEAAQPQQQEGQHAVCEAPVRAVLQGVLDLSGSSPRRYLFQVLSHFTSHELHKERLEYFATAEGRDDLYRYNQKERRSLLEVLQDFGSAQPPLECLLEAAPLLQARQFSLASAPAAHGSRAAVLAAVVAWKTPSNRPRKGLVTSWLSGLQAACTAAADRNCDELQVNSSSGTGVQAAAAAAKVPVWIDRGAFRLPPGEETPLLLVGPGTGVAPFRSFCWHRAATSQQQQQTQAQLAATSAPSSSTSMLFFGCRDPTADFYFKAEWWPIMQSGGLHPQHGLVTAFSRHSPQPTQQELLQMLQHAAETPQQPSGPLQIPAATEAAQGGSAGSAVPAPSSGSSKVYVTHKLREHGAAVWRLLAEQGAWVYVSGSAEKMPAGVVSALEEVAATHGGMSKEAAAKFMRQLELTGRYHVEAWS